ncbi:hypothetical protein GH714_042103 [Hevea brasiliensis]|uniref:FYVE-type domain-containing protein n=1 Tax=Hevea brasiliensis TaxID=3981 RepID=A0A6A6MS87_HEVBR|nr:hypothetical protein GH714_042103 [Hevea brasiliensis]
MVIPDTSLRDLLHKVKSWMRGGASDLSPSSLSGEFQMHSNSLKMCCECNTNLTGLYNGYHCQSCGRWFCVKCARGYDYRDVVIESNDMKSNGDYKDCIKSCKLCIGFRVKREGGRKNSEKVHPSESPRESPEPPSPSFRGHSVRSDHRAHSFYSRDCGYSPLAVTSRSMISFSAHPSLVSDRHSSSRSDEEAEDSAKDFYSPSSEYCHYFSDIDPSSITARLEFYSCKSAGSSPLDSPSRIDFTSCRVGHPVQREKEGNPLSQNDGPFDQETVAILRRPEKGTGDPDNNDDYSDDVSMLQSQCDKSQKPLDFESNGCIWLPPPPEDENEEAESNFFTYDDDDDDIGDSGALFLSSSSLSSMFPSKEKHNEDNKEPLRTVIQGHFRALHPCEGSSLYKNIKHKRMTTQYKNPRLLLLGGALEYQSVVNQLASFNTLVQQENDHLKMIMSKIEALRPNVLLVEKSISVCPRISTGKGNFFGAQREKATTGADSSVHGFGNTLSDACHDLESNVGLDSFTISEFEDQKMLMVPPSGVKNISQPELPDIIAQEERQLRETHESTKPKRIDEDGVSSEYFSATDTHKSILVSFSSRCVLKGTVCERSRLLRIKFYGSFDKPLGRYLRDDLFDQTSYCRSCKELAEAHVLCYTHQQGNLTINVRSFPLLSYLGKEMIKYGCGTGA